MPCLGRHYSPVWCPRHGHKAYLVRPSPSCASFAWAYTSLVGLAHLAKYTPSHFAHLVSLLSLGFSETTRHALVLCLFEPSPVRSLRLQVMCFWGIFVLCSNGWGGVRTSLIRVILRPTAPTLHLSGCGGVGVVASASPHRKRCLFLELARSLPSSFWDL